MARARVGADTVAEFASPALAAGQDASVPDGFAAFGLALATLALATAVPAVPVAWVAAAWANWGTPIVTSRTAAPAAAMRKYRRTPLFIEPTHRRTSQKDQYPSEK
jgi:hypothetical protein